MARLTARRRAKQTVKQNKLTMEKLKDQVARLLDGLRLTYDYDDETKTFMLDVGMDNATVSVVVAFDEADRRLYNFSYLSFALPKKRRMAVLRKINEIHLRSSSPAHLLLDEDGRLCAQAVIDVPECGVDGEVFHEFVASTCVLLDKNFHGIMEAAFGQGGIDYFVDGLEDADGVGS